MGYSPRTSRKKNTMFPSRDNSGRCPWMTIRSKQWYTKTSSFPNRERNVSIGRLLVFLLLQQDLRSDGRWNQIHCLATKSTPWDFQGRSPWLLLVHHPRDSHQDHVSLSRAVISASRFVPNLLFYEGPTSQQ